MPSETNAKWPVLTVYEQHHLRRLALPLGGIGTGTVSLGGRGDLRDWEIRNRPAKGFIPGRSFFALHAAVEGGQSVTRALEGLIEPTEYEGSSGCVAANHGMPRFHQASFCAAYPFGQVLLTDDDVPVDVRIEAFNPFIPGDADASGIPIAVFHIALTNKTGVKVNASLCSVITNFTGPDNTSVVRRNELRPLPSGGSGLFMGADGASPLDEDAGTMAIALLDKEIVTHWANWQPQPWNADLQTFWDDFSSDGLLDESVNPTVNLAPNTLTHGALATGIEIAPHAEATVTFLLAWHFPNRMTWTPAPQEACEPGCGCGGARQVDRIGNYYTTQYEDAWDVLLKTIPRLAELEQNSLNFVRAFCGSDLPRAVKEAALNNLSTLRSQTCFRTEDGLFFGWEGCNDTQGCCHGSCTHVWNYEQATAFLFGSLSCSMRVVEFEHTTGDDGRMAFRVNLPLDRARDWGAAAADGQMGCLMKLYRDWRLSGDDGMLTRLWPRARKAIEFCWIPGGWDADQDGVMEGCQHNTMDVEYYGPNPQMTIWYLGALRASEEMARYLGETDFADRCRSLFQRGSAWTDANLFNGDYYEHQIRPMKTEDIHPALRIEGMGARDPMNPDFQLGKGCLVDQLVGQFLAHVCGLGHLTRKGNVRKALRGIMKHNFRPSLRGHFNNMRTYALNDEAALLMASYPLGERPAIPFPYFNEVMTGFEYTAAVGMLYEGQLKQGIQCIEAVRQRYNGMRRNPFDEAECGHHYARAMASWGAVLALTGFLYSGVDQSIEFAPKEGRHFWSNGYAWGTCIQKNVEQGMHVTLTVLSGSLRLRTLSLAGAGQITLDTERRLTADEVMTLVIT